MQCDEWGQEAKNCLDAVCYVVLYLLLFILVACEWIVIWNPPK